METLGSLPEDVPDGFLEAWGGEVLPRAWLPGDDLRPAAAIRFALLHRAYGVALLDLAPDSVPEAVPRFLHAYRAHYPGREVPPVVYRSLSSADLWRLTVLLDSAFANEAAPDPADQDWMGRARALLVRAPVAERVTLAEPVPVRASLAEARPAPPVMREAAEDIRLPPAPPAMPPAAPASSADLPGAGAAPIALPERPLGAVRVVAPAVLARPGPARHALPLAVLLLAAAGAGAAAWTGYLPLPAGWLSQRGVEPGGREELAAAAGPSRGTGSITVEPAAGPPGQSAPVVDAAPVQAADAVTVQALDAVPAEGAGEARAPVAQDAPAVAGAIVAPLPEEARTAATSGEATEEVPVPGAPPSGLSLDVAEAPPVLPSGPASARGLPAAADPAPGPLPVVNGVPTLSVRTSAAPLPLPAEALSVPFPVQLAPVPSPTGALPAPPVGAGPRGPRPPVLVEGIADRPGAAALPGAVLPVAQGAALPPAPVAVPPPAPPVLPAAVAAPRPQPVALAPALLQALVRRGDAMLAIGDVSAARLFYERAAAAGSAAAATAMGRSFDPQVLATLGTRGLRGDPEAAAAWYRRGAALGDPDAPSLAGRLAAVSRGATDEGGRVP